VVDELGFGQGVNVVGKVVTELANGARVGVDGFGLQTFESEVFQMQLVLPVKVGAEGGGGGSRPGDGVHVGMSSRCVAKSRIAMDGVCLQNRPWGGVWGALRVAASSNNSFNPMPLRGTG